MDWTFFLCWLGVGTIIYSIFKAVALRPDGENDKPSLPARILLKLSAPILILSLPAWLVIGATDDFLLKRWSQHFNDKRRKDMRKAIFIAGCTSRPTDEQIAKYGLNCDDCNDLYGRFDVHLWQSHEYERLGL